MQHLKQIGKKNLADLHHIELLSANEVDSLMFKRPLFDKDLTLSVMVPQMLSGSQPMVARAGSFSGAESKTGAGGGGLNLNLNLNFGKSSKHNKHENVQHMKLFALEKALRRDLDAFAKVR